MLPEQPAEDVLASARVKIQHPELWGIADTLRLAPLLDDLETVLVCNASKVEFILPDVGVILHNQWAKPTRGSGVLGYASSGLQVFIPLSSRHILCLYDPDVYEPRRRVRTVKLSKSSDVGVLNRLLCEHAERLVYFSGNTHTHDALKHALPRLERMPREARIQTARFIATNGNQHLVMQHTDQPSTPYPLTWLKVKRSAARATINRRAQSWRDSSLRYARENLETGAREPLPQHRGLRFTKV
jgi:hypothetical protein